MTDTKRDRVANLDEIIRDLSRTRTELRQLLEIRDWAVRSLGLDYQINDRVVICSEEPAAVGAGWEAYSEALAIGREGIAREISFNSFAGKWQVLLAMDRAWSTHIERGRKTTRYWKGPASETPEGYEPPTDYDQNVHPYGKIKLFAMNVHWVKKL